MVCSSAVVDKSQDWGELTVLLASPGCTHHQTKTPPSASGSQSRWRKNATRLRYSGPAPHRPKERGSECETGKHRHEGK